MSTKDATAALRSAITIAAVLAFAWPLDAQRSAARADADAIAALRSGVLAATKTPGVQRGTWGIVVHSLDRSERLLELNPDALLIPASVAKIVTVASAAEAVGWDYRYETALRAAGPIIDGVLQGDLIAVGTGDPTIGGRAGSDLSAWVSAVARNGVRRIEGRIIGDDDLVEEPRPQLAWAWDDLGYVTGAVFGALNLAENRMFVTLEPGLSVGAPTRLTVEPHATGRPIGNRSITGERGSTRLVWPEQRPAEAYLTIDGSLPLGSALLRLGVSVGNPSAWFADVLRYGLAAAGIEITGRAHDIDEAVPRPTPVGATLLYTHRSEPLSAIVQPLLKESINLYAEAVFRLNVPAGVFPTNDAALAAQSARLASWGLPPDSVRLIDGSGLSRRDAITADALATVLERVARSPEASPLVRALPVAGVDGSLENRMRGTAASGNVRAKTGTMSDVRSLAGYVTSKDGERLAFVILLNNFEGSSAQANRAVDAIATGLASFSRRP